jgi:GTPase SAR1 family protein
MEFIKSIYSYFTGQPEQVQQRDPVRTIKLLLVGNGNVGKTTFIKKYNNTAMYDRTVEYTIHHVTSNDFDETFEIIDCGFGDGTDDKWISLCQDMDGAIIMLNVEDPNNSNIMKSYYDVLRNNNMTGPISVVFNKYDGKLSDSTLKYHNEFLGDSTLPMYQISLKNNTYYQTVLSDLRDRCV